MGIKAIPVTDLKKGSVIALPMGRTATLLDDPKPGRTFLNFRTQYGPARLRLTDEILIEVPDEEADEDE